MQLPDNIEVVDGKLLLNYVELIENTGSFKRIAKHLYKGTVVEKGTTTPTITVGDVVYFNSGHDLNCVCCGGKMVIDYRDIICRLI